MEYLGPLLLQYVYFGIGGLEFSPIQTLKKESCRIQKGFHLLRWTLPLLLEFDAYGENWEKDQRLGGLEIDWEDRKGHALQSIFWKTLESRELEELRSHLSPNF